MEGVMPLSPEPSPHRAAAADAIRISGLVKRFGDFTAIGDLSLAVPPGAFLVLVGPSGCGKSTLLRMLAGLDEPTGGEIAFMGKTVSSAAAGVRADPRERQARKSVVSGKSVSVRVDLGGGRTIKKK